MALAVVRVRLVSRTRGAGAAKAVAAMHLSRRRVAVVVSMTEARADAPGGLVFPLPSFDLW